MSVSWLKRSGIQRGEGVANDEWHDTASSVPPEPEVEVTNDKATPVVGDERGIPSVNRSGFRSRALPFSIAALALAAIGVVWLVPSPKTVVPPAKDDPRAADEAVTGSRPVAGLHSAVLLSNGASRIVDLFRLAGWPQVLSVLATDGPAEVIRRVREAEAHHAVAADDATIAHCAALDQP